MDIVTEWIGVIQGSIGCYSKESGGSDCLVTREPELQGFREEGERE